MDEYYAAKRGQSTAIEPVQSSGTRLGDHGSRRFSPPGTPPVASYTGMKWENVPGNLAFTCKNVESQPNEQPNKPYRSELPPLGLHNISRVTSSYIYHIGVLPEGFFHL